MINRFYYTLEELIDSEETGAFKKLFSNWDISFTDSTYTTELFNDIMNRYGSEFIYYLDIDAPIWSVVEKPSIEQIKLIPSWNILTTNHVKKIKEFLEDSRKYYEKLLPLYTASEANLLKKVENISTTQFNDTPQSTDSGLSGDNYASTYTKVNSSNEFGTVIQRLEEIHSYWRNLYSEWSSEFGRAFVIYN